MRFGLAGLTALVVWTSVAAAQPSRDFTVGPSRFGRRYDGFRVMFAEAGLTTASLDAFRDSDIDDWSRWIIVVIGDPAPLDRLGVDPIDFVSAGGVLLVATDQKTMQFASSAHLRIEPGPVEVDGPDETYLGRPGLPIVSEFRVGDALTTGLTAIVTNHPGYIAGANAREWAGAWLPLGARVNGKPLDFQPPFLASMRANRGLLVLVADQSPFINEMLLEYDGANLLFADHLIRELINDRRASDLKALYFEDGEPIDAWIDARFESGGWGGIELPEFVELINEMVVGIESEDRDRPPGAVNALITEGETRLRRDVLGPIMVTAPALLGLIVVILWMMRSLTRTTLAPALERASATSASPDGFALAARELARSFFAGVLVQVDWRGKPPRAKILGGWRERWSLSRKLRQLWKLATASPPIPQGAKSFEKLEAEIVAMRERAEREIIRFLPMPVGASAPTPARTRKPATDAKP